MRAIYLSPTMTESSQLRWWRDATGRTEPAVEPIGCTLTVGRCVVEFYGERLKLADFRSLLTGKARKVKPRALPPAAKFCSFVNGGHRALEYQEAAYRRAMSTGRWAG